MRKGFTKEELNKAFVAIGEKLSIPVTTYLLGGGAMCYRNQKDATKDLDLVFVTRESATEFANRLKVLGYQKLEALEKEYEEMSADGIWEEKNGFRIDSFFKKVCKKLEITPTVEKRSETLGSYGKLTVRIVSNEDIILFKSITDRIDDVNDIAAIVRSAEINWNTILDECTRQSGERPWHGATYSKFFELQEKHGISAPILGSLKRLADKDTIREGLKRRLGQGMNKKEALKELRKMGFTKNELEKV
ncbi:hypothetical protein HYV43_00465 [Candidatus Micrarchaeota archaeon]|nr:hypothetical protein [Candidatus Micrarchaeota archaeon]